MTHLTEESLASITPKKAASDRGHDALTASVQRKRKRALKQGAFGDDEVIDHSSDPELTEGEEDVVSRHKRSEFHPRSPYKPLDALQYDGAYDEKKEVKVTKTATFQMPSPPAHKNDQMPPSVPSAYANRTSRAPPAPLCIAPGQASTRRITQVITPDSRQSPNLDALSQLDGDHHRHPTDVLTKASSRCSVVAAGADRDGEEKRHLVPADTVTPPISALDRSSETVQDDAQDEEEQDRNGVPRSEQVPANDSFSAPFAPRRRPSVTSETFQDLAKTYHLAEKTAIAQKEDASLAYSDFSSSRGAITADDIEASHLTAPSWIQSAKSSASAFTTERSAKPESSEHSAAASVHEEEEEEEKVALPPTTSFKKHELSPLCTEAPVRLTLGQATVPSFGKDRKKQASVVPAPVKEEEEEHHDIPCTPLQQMTAGLPVYAAKLEDESRWFVHRGEVNFRNPFQTPDMVKRHPISLRPRPHRPLMEQSEEEDNVIAANSASCQQEPADMLKVEKRRPEDLPASPGPSTTQWVAESHLRKAYQDPADLFQLVELLYKESAETRRVDPNFAEHQQSMTVQSRLIVVDWIFWVFDLEQRDRSFAYIAIDLFDRFMAATKNVEQVYTLCYAAACCMLAFKLNNSQDESKVANLVHHSDCPEMTEKAIIMAEASLLDALGWSLNIPDYLTIMHFILQNAAALDPQKIGQHDKDAQPKIVRAGVMGATTMPYLYDVDKMNKSIFWLDFAHYEYRFLRYPPPMVCAAVFYMVCTPDDYVLYHASGYDKSQLVPLVDIFNETVGERVEEWEEGLHFQKVKHKEWYSQFFSKNELCYEDGAPVFGDTVKVEPADDGAYGDRFDPHSASNLNWREREEVSRSASEEEEEHFPDDVSPEDSGSEKEEARENGRRASGEQYRNLVSSPTLVSA